MTSGAPDAVLLMVGANAGLIGMSKEHLAIALALSVPVIVAITKASTNFCRNLKTVVTVPPDRYDPRQRFARDHQAGNQGTEKPRMQVRDAFHRAPVSDR
jgi:hypothetical protein